MFEPYLQSTPVGGHRPRRLPAEDDPMYRRIQTIRARDALLIDTLNGHFDNFYLEMQQPYHDWRRSRLEEIENVRELIAWLGRLHDEDPAQGLTELMGRLSLLTSLDTDKEPDQEVRLMTLHGSKGLEFPHVFMAGVEEDLLPHRNSLEEGGEAEERRLMYVGITRAKESLTLSYARNRRRFGEALRCEPSRFLDEIPPIAERLAAEGMDFSYHNHNHELQRIGDRTWLATLYEEVDPKHVKAEIDTYWIVAGTYGNSIWRRFGRPRRLWLVADFIN